MITEEVAKKIKQALDGSIKQSWTAELHLQIIKYSQELKNVAGKEFCEVVGINESYKAEFSKMIKIADRLISAGLDVDKI